MTTSTSQTLFSQRRSPEAALRLLLPYCATVTVIMLATHVISAFAINYTLLILSIGTLLVALILLAYAVLFGKGLDKLRFGGVLVHSFTYVLLVGGNLLHFLLVGFSGTYTDPERYLGDWFGPTVTMGGLWGAGLFLHLWGAIIQNGFEANSNFSPRKQ